MTTGDYVAFGGMGAVLLALAVILIRDWRAERRAQRHLDQVFGHHVRRERARREGRLLQEEMP